MDKPLHFEDLTNFTRQEQHILDELGWHKPEMKHRGPSKETVDFILNYSKALSVRKSKYVQHVKTILN